MQENKDARWYVVHTYTGYENKVKVSLEKIIENRGLSDEITDVRIPTETVEGKNSKGEPKTYERKLFPSYVFVKMKMSDSTWHVVRNITGATGFVGPGSVPAPLTDAQVESLGFENVVKAAPRFNVGSNVKIISGPMSGFSGTVDEIFADNKKVKVNVSVFGRVTPVELDVSDVQLDEN
ncbi:MAG: transcription termination/antitermination protein NusG [Clostridia bacterium]|nr:transcription termination/antitermination protein NusG [Clostridia bacterium]